MANLMFKKFEVIGTTKDEAKENCSLTLMVDATQQYNKWAKNVEVTEESQKEWMKEYLKAKKYDKGGLGAYIVTQTGVLDKRERPYKEKKPTYDVKTHTLKRCYVGRAMDTNEEIFNAKTAKEAAEMAKEFIIDNHVGVNIYIEAKVEEGNALYTTYEYTPTKGAQPYKLLCFGYETIND